MKNLQELAGVLTRYRQKRIEIPKTIPGNFSFNQAKGFQNAMQKTRFKQKLLNLFFFLDLNKTNLSEYVKAEFRCGRQVALFQILMPLGGTRNAEILAKECLATSLKYEFTEKILACLRALILLSSQRGETAKVKNWMKLYEDQQMILNEEMKIANFLSYITSHYSSSSSKKPYLASEIRLFIKTLRQKKRPSTFYYTIYQFRLFLYLNEIEENYEECIKVCTEAEDFVKTRPLFHSNKLLADFGLGKMDAMVRVGRFKEAANVGSQYFNYVDRKSPYWFICAEYYVRCLLLTENFGKALEILRDVIEHPLFQNRPENLKEKWTLYEGYIRMLAEVGVTSKNSEKFNSKKFRLSKLINELPLLSRDIAGFNVAIILLQFSYHLLNGNIDVVATRIEAMKTYMSRQLRANVGTRTYLFLKLLMKLDNKAYDLSKLSHQNTMFLNIAPGQANIFRLDELEILPYHFLWQLIEARIYSNTMEIGRKHVA